MTSKRVPLSWNGVKDLGNLCMPRSAQGVCHSGRVSRFVSADVGLGVEMCAGKVENTAWKRDCLRTCREKCGEVRRRDAIQSVYRWLPAHMSGEGEEENMGGEETDSSLALRMTKGRSE